MRSALLTTRVAGLAAAATLATTMLATTGGGTAAAAPAGGPGHWSRVTPNGSDNIQDIGLARGGHSTLHMIWASLGTGKSAIHDTVIAASGAVRKARTIAGGQSSSPTPTPP